MGWVVVGPPPWGVGEGVPTGRINWLTDQRRDEPTFPQNRLVAMAKLRWGVFRSD